MEGAPVRQVSKHLSCAKSRAAAAGVASSGTAAASRITSHGCALISTSSSWPSLGAFGSRAAC